MHKSENLVLIALIATLMCSCKARDDRGTVISNYFNNSQAPSLVPVPTPTPGPTPDPTPTTTNAKVFIKNPVSAAQATISYKIVTNVNPITTAPSTPQNYDSYLVPVMLSGTSGGYLQNADIKIQTDYISSVSAGPGAGLNVTFTASTMARAQADLNNNWNFSSLNDSSHRLGQVMAYYWINQEKITANNAIPNGWHPTGKNVNVYSYCYDGNNNSVAPYFGAANAFWAGLSSNFMCMGWLGPMELDFDASIYAHEMGHANVDYATAGQITAGPSYSTTCPFSSQAECCPTSDGCAGAINEGQADVHAYILFNSGVLAEFLLNNLTGLPARDADLNTNLTAQAMFAGTAVNPSTGAPYGNNGKEIHFMGGVWGSSWWTLRQSLGASVADKIFFAHLELLTSADTFKTALNAIVTADQTLVTNGTFTTNHKSQILAAFNQHGITP